MLKISDKINQSFIFRVKKINLMFTLTIVAINLRSEKSLIINIVSIITCQSEKSINCKVKEMNSCHLLYKKLCKCLRHQFSFSEPDILN